MITILQLMALGDSNEVKMLRTDEHGAQKHLEIDKVSPLLEPLDPNRFRHRKLLYGGVDNPISLNITPQLVYNSISDPDRCSRGLDRAQHAAKSNPYPFINHPAAVPNARADNLSQIAGDVESLTVPKCIRITPRSLDGLRTALDENTMTPPLLFKEAGTEPERANRFLLESMEQIHELERFAFDGRAYYVKPFVDYCSNDGLYRKYRFFVIGSKILPGHLIISDQWAIENDLQAHTGLQNQMAAIQKEEQAFLKAYQKKRLPALIALQEKLGLDYYAVDCSLDADGGLLIFKVDCGAHVFDSTKEEGYYSAKQLSRFNEAVETMLLNKLNNLQVKHV